MSEWLGKRQWAGDWMNERGASVISRRRELSARPGWLWAGHWGLCAVDGGLSMTVEQSGAEDLGRAGRFHGQRREVPASGALRTLCMVLGQREGCASCFVFLLPCLKQKGKKYKAEMSGGGCSTGTYG